MSAPAAAADPKAVPGDSNCPGEAAKERFLIGTAVSTYQNSGCPASQWTAFQARRQLCGLLPTIANGDRIGVSCDFWNRYEEDLELARGLGSNAFRFSFEWSRVEPARGEICWPAVERFHAILDCMRRKGLEPLATLHHFVHPQWFEALGGFEKPQNIPIFLEWCKLCFRLFGAKVRHWCTFNEPGVYTFSGFCAGAFPPGKRLRFGLAGRVLRNLLIAHTEAYRLIKGMPGGEATQVGLVHNWMPYEARPTPLGRLVWWNTAAARLGHFCWGNQVVLDFLRTGRYDWRPFGAGCCRTVFQLPGGKRPPCDTLGLNYYSRILLDWKLTVVVYPHERASDLRQSIFPQGLHQGLRAFAEVGAPIYIMETGIADGRDRLRGEWAESYFGAVEEAVAAGHDVRGLMYWTLMDNFEWAFGFQQAPFGLYAWDFRDPTQARVERESTRTVIRRLFRDTPAAIERLWQARREGKAGAPAERKGPPAGELTQRKSREQAVMAVA